MAKKTRVNFVTTPLAEFTNSNTLYIQKSKNGFMVEYLCKFQQYNRGNVYGEVLSVKPDYAPAKVGDRITAKAASCYLWGRVPGEKHNSCQWFNPETGGFGEHLEWTEGQISQDRVLQILTDIYLEGIQSYWAEPAKWAMVLADRLGLTDELRASVGGREGVFEFEVEVTDKQRVTVLARDKKDACNAVEAVTRFESEAENRGARVRTRHGTDVLIEAKRKIGKFKPQHEV